MLTLDKYMKENSNKVFLKGLNSLKKRTFCVTTFSENQIDTQKGLMSQRLHENVIDKYNMHESKAEMLSLKLKKFY